MSIDTGSRIHQEATNAEKFNMRASKDAFIARSPKSVSELAKKGTSAADLLKRLTPFVVVKEQPGSYRMLATGAHETGTVFHANIEENHRPGTPPTLVAELPSEIKLADLPNSMQAHAVRGETIPGSNKTTENVVLPIETARIFDTPAGTTVVYENEKMKGTREVSYLLVTTDDIKVGRTNLIADEEARVTREGKVVGVKPEEKAIAQAESPRVTKLVEKPRYDFHRDEPDELESNTLYAPRLPQMNGETLHSTIASHRKILEQRRRRMLGRL